MHIWRNDYFYVIYNKDLHIKYISVEAVVAQWHSSTSTPGINYFHFLGLNIKKRGFDYITCNISKIYRQFSQSFEENEVS